MNKLIHVTVYPSPTGTRHPSFTVSRIDNALSFELPGGLRHTSVQTVGSQLSDEDARILANNPDFAVSCIERPAPTEVDYTYGVMNAVEKLGGPIQGLQAQLGSVINMGYFIMLAIVVAAFIRR